MDKKPRFVAAKKKFQEEHRRLGLCYDCNNRPDEGKTRCPSCMEKRKLSDQARRAKASSSGLCAKCCRQPTIGKHRLCEDCYFKQTSYDRLGTMAHWQTIKQKFYEQGSQCALSGVALVLGQNAELDHILPSSRDGLDDPANTQWVLCVVNRMKDHMLESEFFELIESLYFKMKGKQERTV